MCAKTMQKHMQECVSNHDSSRVIVYDPYTLSRLCNALCALKISKSECESLKKKLVTLEEDFTQKTQIQAAEMEQTLNDVLTAVQV